MSSREGSDEELLFDGRENIRPQVLALNVETHNDRVSLPQHSSRGVKLLIKAVLCVGLAIYC
jgi:hypothetical protein